MKSSFTATFAALSVLELAAAGVAPAKPNFANQPLVSGRPVILHCSEPCTELTKQYNTLDGGYQWLTDITEATTLKGGEKTTITTQSWTAKNTDFLTTVPTTTTSAGKTITTTSTEYVSFVTVQPTDSKGTNILPIIAGVVVAPALFEALEAVAGMAATKSAEEVAASLKWALAGKKVTLTDGDLQKLSKYVTAAAVAAAAAGVPLNIGPLMKGATISADATSTTPSSIPTVTAIMKARYDNIQEILALPLKTGGPLPSGDDDGDGDDEGSTYDNVKCQRTDANSLDPDAANMLAKQFCTGSKIDFSKDAQLSLGPGLPAPYNDIKVNITFKYTHTDGKCSTSCEDSYSTMIQKCKFTSHEMTGKANVTGPCGTYAMEVIANNQEPTRPEWDAVCVKPDSTHVSFPADEALDVIKAQCKNGFQLTTRADHLKFRTRIDGKFAEFDFDALISPTVKEGCAKVASPATIKLTEDECVAGFTQAINQCDSPTNKGEKQGSLPLTWSGPKGCIDFNFWAAPLIVPVVSPPLGAGPHPNPNKM